MLLALACEATYTGAMNRRGSRGGVTGLFRWLVGATVFVPFACDSNAPSGNGPARDEVVASSSSALIDAPANSGVITVANLSHQTGNADSADPVNVGRFDEPAALAVAPDGTIYIADWGNNSVRRLQPSANVYSLRAREWLSQSVTVRARGLMT
jgi:NHL repeat